MHRVFDFLGGGPNVLEVHRLAALGRCQRILLQVDVNGARNRVRDAQRRRGEVVRLDILVNTGLEVSIAGENAGDGEIAFLDRASDVFGQRTRIADAGCAAISDGVETERIERLGQTRGVQILSDDL